MKTIMRIIFVSLLLLPFSKSATAVNLEDVNHQELVAVFEVHADTNNFSNPVVIDKSTLEVGQEYILGIIDGDGVSIWDVGPLTRTCHGSFMANRFNWPHNTVNLFSLNGLGDTYDPRSFFRFTPLYEHDKIELFISDSDADLADNRGFVEVGLFKIIRRSR